LNLLRGTIFQFIPNPLPKIKIYLDKVKQLLLTPIAGEITEREPYNGYLIFQGGILEVEEFIRKFHK
jgi:hypothetical protein